MKQTQNLNIEIKFGNWHNSPRVNSTSDIVDINEVTSISIKGDIDELFNEMPKSYNWKQYTINIDGVKYKGMEVIFNTWSMNKSTGDKNESAIKRRIRVIKKLKEFGL